MYSPGFIKTTYANIVKIFLLFLSSTFTYRLRCEKISERYDGRYARETVGKRGGGATYTGL